MGEGSTVTVTQQTDEVSHIESEATSEGVSLLLQSRQRYPAVNRPFDDCRAGDDGDELR